MPGRAGVGGRGGHGSISPYHKLCRLLGEYMRVINVMKKRTVEKEGGKKRVVKR